MEQLKGHWQRWFVLALWLALIVAFWVYAQNSEEGVLSLIQSWLEAITENPWGPLVLLSIFMIRPLLLLPITILNAFSGFLFGPVAGLAYAVLATLLSSAIAYGVARFLRVEPNEGSSEYLERLRSRSFETVLTGRLLFLPGDLINYAAGFLKISFIAFMLATALGGLPGLMVSVLAGASIEGQFSFQGIRINAWYLLASAGLLVFSLGTSYLLRQRQKINEQKI